MHHFLLAAGTLILFSLSAAGSAYSEKLQPESENGNVSGYSHTGVEKEEHGLIPFLVGKPAQDSIYLGMWSYHLVDDDEPYQSTHNLIGLTYKGFFLGTFENSRSDRAWAVGLQRDVYNTSVGVLSVDMGYRIGLMHGYEKMEIFDSGIFPLVQLYGDVRYKRAGLQLSWAGSAVTAGFFLRF